MTVMDLLADPVTVAGAVSLDVEVSPIHWPRQSGRSLCSLLTDSVDIK
jgi:hypothetical protein